MVMNLSLLCQEWFADCIAKTFDRNLSSVGNDAGFLKKQKEATWLQNDESLIIKQKVSLLPLYAIKDVFVWIYAKPQLICVAGCINYKIVYVPARQNRWDSQQLV